MDMKNVIISITGTQHEPGGGKNSMELITDGEYFFKNGEGRLTYMESPVTGLEGTRTSFTVGPMGVVMSREGAVTSSMVFQEGKKNFFLYETPYGSATMGVDTRRLRTALGEHGGDMEIDYDVDFEHTPVGRNQFRINIKEQDTNA